MRRHGLIFVVFLPLLALLQACGALNRMNIVSEPEEIRIGSRVAALIDANARLLDDRMIQEYVEGVTNRLGAVSERPDLTYRVRLIEDDTVNAFALPGGYLYVMTGLLDAADSEAELASVISHEIANIAKGHAMRRYTKAQLFSLAAMLGGGYIPGGVGGSLARSGVNLGTALAFLKFSRTDETEADTAGLAYMDKAGYAPEAAAAFLLKLEKEREEKEKRAKESGHKKSTVPPTILSTHPAPEKRADRVTVLTADLHAREGAGERAPRVADTLYFRMVKERLAGHTERIATETLEVPDLTKKGDVIPEPPEGEIEPAATPGKGEPPAMPVPGETSAGKDGEEMPIPALVLSPPPPPPVAVASPGQAAAGPPEAAPAESIWAVSELPLPRLYQRWQRPGRAMTPDRPILEPPPDAE